MNQSDADRRTLLKSAGLAALGAVVGLPHSVRGAQAPERSPQQVASSQRRLAKPNISPARLIRTTVGLRPARTGGFRVEAVKFDAMTVVHNYGHGGDGFALSWGTAQLAVQEVMKTSSQRCAVLGCGTVGLATARLLQQRGFDVTIYAKELPPETTSSRALAMWGPIAGDPRLLDAARFAHRHFQTLVGDYYGVRWVERYSRPDDLLDELFQYVDLQEVRANLHPFPIKTSVLRWMGLLIEPPIYLNALTRDFQLAGGRIVVRDFANLQSVLALPEPVVVNCSGLGSRTLFDDENTYPRKGQLLVFLPQPEVDYELEFMDLVSRKDGLVLGGGGGGNPNDFSLEPNEEAGRQSMARAMRFFDAMR